LGGELRNRDQLAGASSERTWLVGILKRKMVDHLRRQHWEQPASTIAADDWMDDLFDQGGQVQAIGQGKSIFYSRSCNVKYYATPTNP
jgi:DNA-directed RNA polymerase specialized sigma24 family protein